MGEQDRSDVFDLSSRYARSVLREIRRLGPRELDASHVAVELRTPDVRVAVHRGRNVVSDYRLLALAAPFLEFHGRIALTLVLEGGARFEEGGRRAFLEPGDLVLDALSGTEAHGGVTSEVLVLEWNPVFGGAPEAGRFELARLGPRDHERIAALARTFDRDASVDTMVTLLDIVRSVGVPLERLTRGDVEHGAAQPEQQALADAVTTSLSHLEGLPAIEEVSDALGLPQRTVNRRLRAMADEYNLSWTHWRSALHQTRVLTAIRLLAAPGATTELVARLSGFRSPTGLCHAFAEAGLPSPGVLARSARRDVLAAWADYGH